jgi:hypothetical protein
MIVIIYLMAFCPLKNLSLLLIRHHYRWRTANIYTYLALLAFSSENSSPCHRLLWHGTSFSRSYPKDSWFSLLNADHLAKEQSLCIFTWGGWSLDESSTNETPSPYLVGRDNIVELNVSSTLRMPPHSAKVLKPCLIFSNFKGDNCQKSLDQCNNALWKNYALWKFFSKCVKNWTTATHFEKKFQTALNLGLT